MIQASIGTGTKDRKETRRLTPRQRKVWSPACFARIGCRTKVKSEVECSVRRDDGRQRT
jgi:hypothetical protein